MATLNNVELFVIGTHTDSDGRTRTWTLEDLHKIVSQYDPAKQEAPAVIGHPKETAPAYGWVSKLWVDDGTLKGDFEQVAPEFETALKEGRYKKRSISVDKQFNLQHVAFLGAALPAVEGLKDIEFSAGAEFETYEFTANEGIKPEEDDTMEMAELLAENKQLKDEIEKLKKANEDKKSDAELKAAKDETEAVKKEFAEYKKAQDDKSLESRVNSLVETGRLLPADKDEVMAFAKAMDDGTATMNFSKKDGSSEQVSPREAYLRKLEAAEPNNLTEEFAKDGTSNFSQAQGEDDATDLACKM
ncbi:hypothetical protein [Maridesulfovibrio sp.]|uniref:hypothetical protein n=1 Tax=Maridesulfovibrio sp. TaxID=2795000 RepID=UPI002A188670|nr:hypothetical protein [Maridesulfovibrio sp.]